MELDISEDVVSAAVVDAEARELSVVVLNVAVVVAPALVSEVASGVKGSPG